MNLIDRVFRPEKHHRSRALEIPSGSITEHFENGRFYKDEREIFNKIRRDKLRLKQKKLL